MHSFYTLSELSALTPEKAREYAAFLRKVLVERVKKNGGHLASNLGVVEISLALCRTLSFPEDRVIYDTGHQSYVHKILTGRGEDFETLRQTGGLSGFPRRAESAFDAFGTGHSGTALSAAVGFARADALQGKKGFSVAVIGDGAFGCGEVLEAMNNILATDRVIIILNDNGMSIGKSVGRFRQTLSRMRSASYYRFKSSVEDVMRALPVLGEGMAMAAGKVKKVIKRQALPTGNLFEELGLHYFGPADGHDLERIEFLIREAKKREGPSVIHLCTKKGKGYGPAEKDPSLYHGLSPRGERKTGKSYSALFGEEMCRLAEKDKRVTALSAAMTDGVGLSDFARTYPNRFFDTGIAEEHALTFSSALAASGLRPVLALYSTFFQRCIDQLIHDAALQKLPLILALDRAGFAGEDGPTHHGLYDLPLLLPVPGVKIYAPATEGEMRKALERGLSYTEGPSVIRYPKGSPDQKVAEALSFEGDFGRFDFGEGAECAIVCFGRTSSAALEAAKARLARGESTAILRFFTLKGFDAEKVKETLWGIKYILLAEEGMEAGSFSRYLLSKLEGLPLKSRVVAVNDTIPHGKTADLLHLAHLDGEGLEREVEILAKT